jgi:NTE family protein
MNPAPKRTSSRPRTEKPVVAVVLSGAAARGAFQAGALAEIIPVMEREGLRPSIWLGTSAGSINAVLWGAAAHLSAAQAAEDVVQVRRRMNDHNVFRPLLSLGQLRSGLQYVGGALLGQGPGTTSLLDTEPLHRTAVRALRTGQLATNVDDGALMAVGVVATRMPQASDDLVNGAASGRSVLFLDEHQPSGYGGDRDRALDVVRGRIAVSHVMASSAIPVAFPPVEISTPEAAGGWYMDGGVRLNTPLHPAVGLGATRILLVSATATSYGPRPPPTRAARPLTRPMRRPRCCTPCWPTGRSRTWRNCAAPTGWWPGPRTPGGRTCSWVQTACPTARST